MTTKTTTSFLYGSVISAGLVLLPLFSPAADDTLTITVEVVSTCSVDTPLLDFNEYDPTSLNPLDAETTLQVLCTTSTPLTVSLGTGSYAEGGSERKLGRSDLSDRLDYELYSDVARSARFDDEPANGTPVGADVKVYGRIAPNQMVTTGIYTDAVAVSLAY